MNIKEEFEDLKEILKKNNLDLEVLDKTQNFPFKQLDQEIEKYKVELESDPSDNLQVIINLFEKIQGYKNLVVTILNRAIKIDSIRTKFKEILSNLKKTEFNNALLKILGDEKLNKEFKTDKLREAKAQELISRINQFYNICLTLSIESGNFVQRVKNVLNNLDSAAQQLSRQLTAIMFIKEIEEPSKKVSNRGKIRLNLEDEEQI